MDKNVQDALAVIGDYADIDHCPDLAEARTDIACYIAELEAEIAALKLAAQWQPIETAPRNRSVLLACPGSSVKLYCGRERWGGRGEPQPNEFAWRCDSSGTFANPTHWMPLPPPPKESP